MRVKLIILVMLGWVTCVKAVETGASVAVVYNSKMPQSKEVAEYYAAKRGVPAKQILGLPLAETESISRFAFKETLETPLRRWLESNDLLSFRSQTSTTTNGQSSTHFVVKEAKVKYVVLCYGVPLRILNDPNLKEDMMEKVQAELRRNGAAVDTELALIPLYDFKPPLTGILRNPAYGATNAALAHPTNGVLLVTRLDGPTPAIAKGLVDMAMAAETNGLWGRAYFDLRNIKEGDYKLGDDWINTASEVARRAGFDAIRDELPEVYSPAFPMSQIALYAGWYDGNASGPFAQPMVEFMPGAFAYHLHSYSAQTLRTTNANWVGPLLAKGVTATMGCVDEPYLSGTPDIGTFFARFIFGGFSFGEAAYASQGGLSWQTTIIGDPLYRPFGVNGKILHDRLTESNNPLVEWSHQKVVNLNMAQGYPVNDVINYLDSYTVTKASAVLQEKLGELFERVGRAPASILSYERALANNPTPMQRRRILEVLAAKYMENKREKDAVKVSVELLKLIPEGVWSAPYYKRAAAAALAAGQSAQATIWTAKYELLTRPEAPAK